VAALAADTGVAAADTGVAADAADTAAVADIGVVADIGFVAVAAEMMLVAGLKTAAVSEQSRKAVAEQWLRRPRYCLETMGHWSSRAVGRSFLVYYNFAKKKTGLAPTKMFSLYYSTDNFLCVFFLRVSFSFNAEQRAA
jgi:hypothetical protein